MRRRESSFRTTRRSDFIDNLIYVFALGWVFGTVSTLVSKLLFRR